MELSESDCFSINLLNDLDRVDIHELVKSKDHYNARNYILLDTKNIHVVVANVHSKMIVPAKWQEEL